MKRFFGCVYYGYVYTPTVDCSCELIVFSPFLLGMKLYHILPSHFSIRSRLEFEINFRKKEIAFGTECLTHVRAFKKSQTLSSYVPQQVAVVIW